MIKPGIGDARGALGHDQAMRAVQRIEPSSDDERNSVAKLDCILHVVRRQQDGLPPFLLRKDDLLHDAAVRRVKPVGRFVEEQQLRIMRQRPHKVQPAFHALGIVRYPLVRIVFKTHHAKQFIDGPRLSAIERAEEAEILPCRELFIQRGKLEIDADHLIKRRADLPALHAVHLCGALIPRQHPQQNSLQGALSGAGRAKESEDLPSLHREAHILDQWL